MHTSHDFRNSATVVFGLLRPAIPFTGFSRVAVVGPAFTPGRNVATHPFQARLRAFSPCRLERTAVPRSILEDNVEINLTVIVSGHGRMVSSQTLAAALMLAASEGAAAARRR